MLEVRGRRSVWGNGRLNAHQIGSVRQKGLGDLVRPMDAGLSAYFVDELQKDRIKSILDVMIPRFKAFNNLRSELKDPKAELADRKLINRAKRILMKRSRSNSRWGRALLEPVLFAATSSVNCCKTKWRAKPNRSALVG